jgi:hypothetical protein
LSSKANAESKGANLLKKMRSIIFLIFAGILQLVISEELPDYNSTQCDSGKFRLIHILQTWEKKIYFAFFV